jgi:phosphoribosylglycinamide formyltransferase 1
MRTAVLASGSGTLLEAILADGIPVCLVIADRPCRALEIAEDAGVEALLLERSTFGEGFDRGEYTRRLVADLRERGIELVVMAGFGTILAPQAFAAYRNRILNTHPALLPAFKGWHAVRAALEAGVEVTGCTVHVATEEVDEGPILAQAEVPVLPGDDEATLHERIKDIERRLYPATIRAVLADPTALDKEPMTR